MKTTQKWWESKITVSALLALFFFVIKNWFGFEIPNWDEFVTLLLAVLAGLGVINNGYNPTGWGPNK